MVNQSSIKFRIVRFFCVWIAGHEWMWKRGEFHCARCGKVIGPEEIDG